MGRAERRHHMKRVKARARRIWREVWGYRGANEDPQSEEAYVQNADHLKSCNGPCCKNPRRSGWEPSGGKTLAEQSDKEQAWADMHTVLSDLHAATEKFRKDRGL